MSKLVLYSAFAAITSGPWFSFAHAMAEKSSSESPFVVASPYFATILGAKPKLTVIFNESLPWFHEAGVYHPPTDSLFAVSDTINDPSIDNNQTTQVLVHVANISTEAKYTVLTNISLSHPTSGARYLHGSVDLIAILAAGNEQDRPPAGLYFLNPYPPFNVTSLTTSYGGYPFNSPNDATVFPDGSIYFSDPVYGFENGLRSTPSLPNQIYRHDPATKTTRVIADGFGRPNGIAHSPDGEVLYVSDTGASVGNGTIDSQGQRSTYAFSIGKLPSGAGRMAGPFATDRRVFAMPDVGANDGRKTDTQGNVYGQTTDGLQVWNPNGELLGKVLYADDNGGNFGFAQPGVMYLMGATVLYKLVQKLWLALGLSLLRMARMLRLGQRFMILWPELLSAEKGGILFFCGVRQKIKGMLSIHISSTPHHSAIYKAIAVVTFLILSTLTHSSKP